MMSQQKILTFKRIEKPLIDSNKVTVITNKQKLQIDDAYKEFFASLFKIKDKDVQRRVLQAVNGQNLTCADCANRIQSKVSTIKKNPEHPTTFNSSTQTLDKDFEYLEKINISPKTMNNIKTNNNNRECFMLNKIQLGRARRKFEPYAVKMKTEKCIIPNNKMKYEPDSLLVSEAFEYIHMLLGLFDLTDINMILYEMSTKNSRLRTSYFDKCEVNRMRLRRVTQ